MMYFTLVVAIALLAPAQDATRIFVYAQQESAAGSWLPVSCDGAAAAALKRGRFFAINVAPGRHAVSIDNGVPASVELHSGEDVFVRLDWNYEVGRPAIPVLHIVSVPEAKKEMRFLSYIDGSKVVLRSVPKTDPRAPTRPQLKERDDPAAK